MSIGFINNHADIELDDILSIQHSYIEDEYIVTIKEIKSIGYEDVYDVTVDRIHAFDANGIYISNCGEQFLPHNGACDLGSMNLTQYVNKTFADIDLNDTNKYDLFDFDKFAEDVATAIRFLDNVLDVTEYPTDDFKHMIQLQRRIGLGLTGLADTYALMGIRYGDNDECKEFTKKVMETMRNAAYSTSVLLAKEKGTNELVKSKEQRESYVAGKFINRYRAERTYWVTWYS